jgi:hypothetical protein
MFKKNTINRGVIGGVTKWNQSCPIFKNGRATINIASIITSVNNQNPGLLAL